jgi:4'-phosphopantetheinyl transferase EntD
MKAAAQHRRLDRALASARDDNMQVAMKVALRGLRRVGLDIEKLAAAADPLSVINEAMDKAKLNPGERMQLKTVLANVGAID